MAVSARTAARAVPSIPFVARDLKCGARLLVSRRRGASVTGVQVHIRGGHSLDPTGKEGTAYLTGALADQGTARHTYEQIAGLLEPAGGSVVGDSAGLAGSIASAQWKRLLSLVCELLTEPEYPAAKVRRHRERVLDRLRVDQDNPRVQASRAFGRLVYGDHWLSRSDTGTPESVATIQRRGLLAHHARNWCGARTLIVVCGDVHPDEVGRLLDRKLGSWKRGTALAPTSQDFPARGPRTAFFQADRQQAHVYLGHLGIRRRDEDYAALLVMDHMLGAGPGFTPRIPRILRDEMGLAYTVSASITSSAGVLPGCFTAYIGTSPEHVPLAVRVFLDEIRRVQDERVSPAELELAKGYLTGSMALGFERTSRRVQYGVFAERNQLGKRHLEDLFEQIEAVTADDVRDAAGRHLFPDKACLSVGGAVRPREWRKLVT